jgi:rsbT co-antagonist protein RsbR
MRINQYLASLSLLILELVATTLGLIYFTLNPAEPEVQFGLLVLVPLIAAMLFGAWRRWPWINQINVVIASLITALLLVNPARDIQFSPVVFAPMGVAVVVTSANWTLGCALAVLAAVVLRSGGQGPFVRLDYLLCYLFVAGCLYLGRLILEQAQIQAGLALSAATAERQLAEQYAQDARTYAADLEARGHQQHRLLETLAALETPAIEVSPQVLLAPIVGHFDAQRADSLTTRLLSAIAARRIHTLILDITGLALLDAAVAEQLVLLARGVRLLGATVIISGISPDSATALVQLGANLGDVRTTSTPADALGLAGQMTT